MIYYNSNIRILKIILRKENPMAKSGTRPVNGPSTTGNPSGKGCGNNPPKK